MCTVSWLIADGRYELFDNRDESLRRSPARAPEVELLAGVRVIAPRDGDAGGTWIGVNELGLTLALLNAWHLELPEPAGGFVSRGLLVRSLLDAATAAQVAVRLAAGSLERYRGFQLAAFEPGLPAPRVASWDGARLAEVVPVLPLVSSSRGPERAQRERRAALERLAEGRPLDRELLARFHASHLPERGSWSACMHRADAETKSASHVCVDERWVSFRYAAGAPCRAAWGEPLRLARRVPVAAGR